MPSLNKSFVKYWSRRYWDEITDAERASEEVLFEKVGPAVASRGHFTKAELLIVGKWKSQRSQGLLKSNDEKEVECITRLALEAPEKFGYRILILLTGVAVPTASALLTVWKPDEYTVTDIRLNGAMSALGKEPGKIDDYIPYVTLCRNEARKMAASLRDLDRALWTWDKLRRPETW